MAAFTLSVARTLHAPVEVVYRCLADYRHHHRPAPGFLPPAFTSLDVLRGGVGAGTTIRFTTRLLGRSVTRTQDVSEPEPGRVLVESGNGEGSTFTLTPDGPRCHLRIDIVLQASGLERLLLKALVKPVFLPLFDDELERLDRYAQALASAEKPVANPI